MKKAITLVGINFYPEDSAIGLYSTEMAQFLQSNDYHLQIVTGFPYYPSWRISEDYERKGPWIYEKVDGMDIYRFKQYVPKNPTFFKRILHLLSFTIGSLVNLPKVKKSDVVICIVPFTSSILLGWILKIFHNSKLWIHVQDFEFDAAIDSGLISKSTNGSIKVLLRIEKFLLNRANIVSTISMAMMDKLRSKSKSETYYLPNWINTQKFVSKGMETHRYLNSNKFKILYSGNIGAKQDWSFFVKFIQSIKTFNDIEVIVVGEGADKKWLINNVGNSNQIKFYDLVPIEDLPSLLQSADLHILFQKPKVVDTVMPSKILGMMASGKPSIITGAIGSEVKKIIDDSKGGYYFSSNNVQEVVEAVLNVKNSEVLSTEMGVNAKTYVSKKFSKESILESFKNRLETL